MLDLIELDVKHFQCTNYQTPRNVVDRFLHIFGEQLDSITICFQMLSPTVHLPHLEYISITTHADHGDTLQHILNTCPKIKTMNLSRGFRKSFKPTLTVPKHVEITIATINMEDIKYIKNIVHDPVHLTINHIRRDSISLSSVDAEMFQFGHHFPFSTIKTKRTFNRHVRSGQEQRRQWLRLVWEILTDKIQVNSLVQIIRGYD